jgi:hypothetical protein
VIREEGECDDRLAALDWGRVPEPIASVRSTNWSARVVVAEFLAYQRSAIVEASLERKLLAPVLPSPTWPKAATRGARVLIEPEGASCPAVRQRDGDAFAFRRWSHESASTTQRSSPRSGRGVT